MSDEDPTSLPQTITSSADADPFSMMKDLRRKANSDSGSTQSGNNSDNSALVSIGNNSFGFNFDGVNGPGSEQNENSSDSDGGNGPLVTKVPAASVVSSSSCNMMISRQDKGKSSGSSTSSSVANFKEGPSHSNEGSKAAANRKMSAEESAARLTMIASSCLDQNDRMTGSKDKSRKRKALGSEHDSGGYNSDDDDDISASQSKCRSDSRYGDSLDGSSKKRGKGDKKREERNAREKERSFRISKQINELRDLLSGGGVILPKGTKSSVLIEAANYIRMLQQHQFRSEIERHQLIQQMHLIGGGAHGPQAAAAIRHAAALNGVWSLGSFGGMPPKSAMTCLTPAVTAPDSAASVNEISLTSAVTVEDYRFIFNSCGVGMAIVSMGGAFLDGNELFFRLSEYTKQELCSQTIFNLTARCDLQHAFDLISQMISPPMDGMQESLKQVVLRGMMKNRNDLGLSVSMVKGGNGVAKCFCVTLIKNPSSPFDLAPPVPVSFDAVLATTSACPGTLQMPVKDSAKLISMAPAFTSG